MQAPDQGHSASPKDNDERQIYTRSFRKILQEEHSWITQRRAKVSQKDYLSPYGPPKPVTTPEPVSKTLNSPPDNVNKDVYNSVIYDTVGLSLSGGGIRSATFCLGVLQALDHDLALGRIDYLSSVSGGGYIACATCTTMQKSPSFIFSTAGQIAGEPTEGIDPADRSDTAAVRHLRNYSKYLIPNGISSLLANGSIIFRGLVASFIMTLGVIFFASFITLLVNPDSVGLTRSWLARNLYSLISFFSDDLSLNLQYVIGPNMPITKILGVILILYMAAWAVFRSMREAFFGTSKLDDDINGFPVALAQILTLVLFVFAALEIQPQIILYMLAWIKNGYSLTNFNVNLINFVGITSLGIGVLVALSTRALNEEIKRNSGRKTFGSMLQKLIAQSIIYIGSAALPLIIYLSYVWITTVAICQNEDCSNYDAYLYAPPLLKDWGFAANFTSPISAVSAYPMITVYAIFTAILFAVALTFAPNANSLHRLYRDRLANAFLIEEKSVQLDEVKKGFRDPENLHRTYLSSLIYGWGPFPIMNAALNIQGSKYLNRRGRNAEFFQFTPLRVGSEATGFVRTDEIERQDPRLDIAAVMAISGAAVSSNMGSKSVRFMSLTLALLNLRLGYWSINPKIFRQDWKPSIASRLWGKIYLLSEALGKLDETGSGVYLTDGGHIENLGLYALLKRRCSTIIVVDAEADQEYSFRSLVDVQRYARIDLGVRIYLPWEEIRDHSKRVDRRTQRGDLPADYSKFGRHVAVGRIEYSDGMMGLIVYVKASLSGDESDVILDYKKRNRTFPHETTGDQFFTEEQFEVYRALGFHILHGFLNGRSSYAGEPANVTDDAGRLSTGPLAELRQALGLIN